MDCYKVVKAYNNNVLLATSNFGEVILVGKGIGFNHKCNATIPLDAPGIDKVFSAAKGFSSIDRSKAKLEEVVEVINKAVTPIVGELHQPLKSQMAEHIGFAIDRAIRGWPVVSDFNDAIKLVHARAYKASEIAQDIISEKLGITFYEDEKCFIALYIQAAANNYELMEVVGLARLVKTALDMVGKAFGFVPDPYESSCRAFMIHVKMCIAGVLYDRKIDVNMAVAESLRTRPMAEQIAKMLYHEKEIVLPQKYIDLIALDVLFILQCNKLEMPGI